MGVQESVGDRLETVVKRATRKHEKRVVLVAGGAGVGDAGGDDATGAQSPHPLWSKEYHQHPLRRTLHDNDF